MFLSRRRVIAGSALAVAGVPLLASGESAAAEPHGKLKVLVAGAHHDHSPLGRLP